MTAPRTPSAWRVHAILSDSVTAPSSTAKMNVVIVGHVDHGKSTVVGRLLADTGRAAAGQARRRAQASASAPASRSSTRSCWTRCPTSRTRASRSTPPAASSRARTRDYIIIDAPGHIEFLKNMISGAARAEAAVLVIDAKEGVRENSRRHGYILSMLGIRQVVVCVNKMDLVDYDQAHFDAIEQEYRAFLESIGAVSPRQFIPVARSRARTWPPAARRCPGTRGRRCSSCWTRFPRRRRKHRPAAAHAGAGGLQVHRARRRPPHHRRAASRPGRCQGRRQGGVLAVEQGRDDQEHRGLQHAAAHRASRPAGRRASR